MDAYDLSHKLAYAGAHSPVPFETGPQYLNSVPGVPVLSELRIFIHPEFWSVENVMKAAREICRVLGPGAQFDIGMTLSGTPIYDAQRQAAGNIARLLKLNPDEPRVVLRLRVDEGDAVYEARFPRLQFERVGEGEDYWRSVYGPAVVKPATQL